MAGKQEKPEEIVSKLRQVEVLQGQGATIADAVRQIGMTQQTFYRWRKLYGGMQRSQLTRLKELEKENQRLRIPAKIDTVRSKYLNNRIEQDHRFIKRMTRPHAGLQELRIRRRDAGRIEVAHMIRKGQLGSGTCGFRQFAKLAG